ncbi:hypothetical protein C1H46_013732 [Malus baccata]|uniref:Alginate lyase 2 domain-containing protein n=1 Tax=Malus baccata TaxID=106549 RepID=A0A540MR14_MALBA|nr:hypothetical protein C1H46_013732 [Malus baccata]
MLLQFQNKRHGNCNKTESCCNFKIKGTAAKDAAILPTVSKKHGSKKDAAIHPPVTARRPHYSSGVWQFEGYGYVPCGTANVTIMQVFGGSPHATTFMLRVGQNGTLTYYRSAVLASNMYDRWFRLNVIHDANASHLKVYIDGVLKFEAPGRGGTSHYFKCGVYSQPDGSYYMESRWKGIKVLKKCG